MSTKAKQLTAHSQTREGFKSSEKRFRTLIENSLDAIALLSAEGTFLYLSPSVSRVFGYSPEELLGCNGFEYVPKENISYVAAQFEDIVSIAGKTKTVEHQFLHKNGSVLWIESTVTNLLHDPDIHAIMSNFRNITDRKRAEEQLRGERERLALAQKAARIGTFEWFIQENSIFWTPELEALYGLPPGGFEGKYENWAQRVHPDDLKRAEESLWGVINSGAPCNVEFRVLWKDGSLHWMVAKGEVFYEDTTPVRMVGVNIEITDRKQAEEAYKESEARKSAFFETALDAIITMDHKEKMVEFNPAAEKVFGYTHEEAVGRELASLIIPPEYRESHRKGLAHYLVSSEGKLLNRRINITAQRKDGTLFPVELTIMKVQKEGNPLFTSTLRDITRRKHIENNIQFLSEASKVLSSSLDYQTTLATVANLAIRSVADWCAIDIVSKDESIERLAVAHKDPKKVIFLQELQRLYPPDPNSSSLTKEVIKSGNARLLAEVTDEMLKKRSHNEEHYRLLKQLGFSSVIIVPLYAKEKELGSIMFVLAELGHHYTQVDMVMAEQLGSRAALAIENARLYAESQKAIVLRNDFISIASHELKTPLTSLKMYTQVLQKQHGQQGEESLTRTLAKMDAQIGKLTVLIGDLLNVSKIQLGKLEFREEVFDLNEVVKETVEHIQATTKKYTIRTEGRIMKNIWGDKDRIGQVITNLLTNAMKYSPEADMVLINLTAEQDVAIVTVQDFGIGIAKDHQRNIFQRFYRVNDPEEKTFPGLGIGLHISHEIITRHGGTMTVVSEKGKGAQFSFTLPYTLEPVKTA